MVGGLDGDMVHKVSRRVRVFSAMSCDGVIRCRGLPHLQRIAENGLDALVWNFENGQVIRHCDGSIRFWGSGDTIAFVEQHILFI